MVVAYIQRHLPVQRHWVPGRMVNKMAAGIGNTPAGIDNPHLGQHRAWVVLFLTVPAFLEENFPKFHKNFDFFFFEKKNLKNYFIFTQKNFTMKK